MPFPISTLPTKLKNLSLKSIHPKDSINFLQINKELRDWALNNGLFPRKIQKLLYFLDGNDDGSVSLRIIYYHVNEQDGESIRFEIREPFDQRREHFLLHQITASYSFIVWIDESKISSKNEDFEKLQKFLPPIKNLCKFSIDSTSLSILVQFLVDFHPESLEKFQTRLNFERESVTDVENFMNWAKRFENTKNLILFDASVAHYERFSEFGPKSLKVVFNEIRSDDGVPDFGKYEKFIDNFLTILNFPSITQDFQVIYDGTLSCGLEKKIKGLIVEMTGCGEPRKVIGAPHQIGNELTGEYEYRDIWRETFDGNGLEIAMWHETSIGFIIELHQKEAML